MDTAEKNYLNDNYIKKVKSNIKKELNRITSYTPKIGVFGDSGVGKSSLCNAIFGQKIAAISDVKACTREPQEILVHNENGGGIVLVDVPGVGEDPERHEEYMELYQKLAPELDLVIWAIKADDRKYSSAISVYNNILKPNLKSCPVIFAITQVDKIEPYRNWNEEKNTPGEKQEHNILIKTNDISKRFDVSAKYIVPVASNDSYNLVELVNRIVEVLPNEKKYSFVRETKEENVSEEAIHNVQTGIIERIKEIAGNTWDFVKDNVIDTAYELITEKAPKIVKKFFSLFSSFVK